MFVDACAIIALLSDEPEAQRVSDAIASAKASFTSPIVVLEAVLGLARPDKFGLTVAEVEPIVIEFLEERGIEIRGLPPADATTRMALSAAHRYRAGRRGLNLGDCLHYACARYYDVPILATADEFRHTDIDTVP
ncbi:type II toxin-antitoxin system VapC family toxin [Ciceribacter thiooxidans]|uniref:Ribonuclease VapC n=1 Tax=Ciceribacter thiooxidans TaxID=1969821 RepID=A0ABV7ID47_9HYPH|nr:type II toxin-antitoxin system VapC family toxin [Ciceribacter thiooxidans]MDI6838328.1 type II toxin-antitoxin system VapC family toxin [Rhizobiaceae bacterium]